MTSTLDLGGIRLPLDAVTSTFACLAVRGSGKSNTGVVMAEEMYDAGIPWCAIDPKGDWWGVRSSADGKGPGLSVVIFGGLHADVPLEPAAGAYLADLIAEQRLTSVLDVSEMSKGDQTRFLTAFAERLLKANREPLHMFLEEADEYVPQRVMGDQARLVGAVNKLVKRGRFRGIGVTLLSQRSASVNKDALNQTETLIAGRNTAPRDRDVVAEWVKFQGAPDDLVSSLPGLANGEAWVISPHFLGLTQRVKFRRRRTFDSGATPKVGEVRRQPTRLADVDLAVVKEQMADAIERAKADDPKELRREIAALRKQLAERPTETVEVPVEVRVEVPVLDETMAHSILDALAAVAPVVAQLERAVGDLEDTVHVGTTTITEALGRPAPPPRSPSPAPPRAAPVARATPPRAPRPPVDPDRDVKLKAGAKRMLAVLARPPGVLLTKTQIGTLAGLAPTGGTFTTYWSHLTGPGLIERHGDAWAITDDGLTALDTLGVEIPPAPRTTEEVVAMWRSTLKAGARRMLDALVDAWPEGLTRDELGAAADITMTGGTFGTYLGHLRRNGLAEVEGDTVRAADTIMGA